MTGGDGHSRSMVGVGRVDSRFHGNDGGDDGHSRSPGGVGRVDSRFHGNDGGMTGIPAPRAGLDAWIPVFTPSFPPHPVIPPCHSRENGNPRDCPRHSRHTPGFPPHPVDFPPVIPVKTGIHAIPAPVIPAALRHSRHTRMGIPRHTPWIPPTGIRALPPHATPRFHLHATPSFPPFLSFP